MGDASRMWAGRRDERGRGGIEDESGSRWRRWGRRGAMRSVEGKRQRRAKGARARGGDMSRGLADMIIAGGVSRATSLCDGEEVRATSVGEGSDD